MVSLKEIVKAVKELNEIGFTFVEKIRTSGVVRDELIENFINAILKVVDNGKEDELTDGIVDVYNALVDEIEENEKAEEASFTVNEIQEEKQKKEIKEEAKNVIPEKKRFSFRKNSRPAMLYGKILENKTLDELLSDEELLEKYNRVKSWIRADYKRIMEKMKDE